MLRFINPSIFTDLRQIQFIQLLKDKSVENIILKSFINIETVTRKVELIELI